METFKAILFIFFIVVLIFLMASGLANILKFIVEGGNQEETPQCQEEELQKITGEVLVDLINCIDKQYELQRSLAECKMMIK